MRTWNVHAWYVTGILLALLIGTLSVKLNPGENLGAIVSFALGLSSLILAIVAIVQSLVGGSEVSKSLGDVRSASAGIQTAAEDLKALAGQVSGASQQIAQTQMDLAQSIREGSTSSGQTAPSTAPAACKIDLDSQSFGGAIALYAAAKSVQTGKAFVMRDFFEGKDLVLPTFSEGYLNALIRSGVIKGDFEGIRQTIVDLGVDPISAVNSLKKMEFASGDSEDFKSILSKMDAYFSTKQGD
jgi:hypothetical protein